MEFNREELSRELLKSFEEQCEIESQEEEKPRALIKLLVFFIVLSGIGFAFYALNTDKIAISREGVEIPIIRSDSKPVRFKPLEPGGMTIDNRDKKIYEAIASTSSNEGEELPNVVHLVPKSEEPVSRQIIKSGDANFAGIFDSTKAAKIKPVADEIEDTQIKPVIDVVEDAQIQSVTDEVEEVKKLEKIAQNSLVNNDVFIKSEKMSKDTTMKIDSSEDILTVDDIKNVDTDKNSKRVVEPKKVETGYKLQLGSYRSEYEVENSWNKIFKLYSSLLGDVGLITEKADLGDKGIFYRLQVGGFSSEEKARKICKELIEQKQGCFIVKK